MKKILLIHTFIFILVYFSKGNIWNEISRIPIITNINYERNTEKEINCLEMNTGFINYFENEEREYDFDSDGKECHINACFIDNFNLLNFGLNYKSYKSDKNKIYGNFQLFEAQTLFNLRCKKQKFYFNIELLNLNSNINYIHNYNWFDFAFGYGYDFINKLESHIIPLAYINLGYNSYQLDKNILQNLSNYSNLNFSNFELILGGKILLFFNPIELDLNADFSKIMDGPNLNVMSIKSKLKFIMQEKKNRFSVDWGYNYFCKNITFFLSSEFKKFLISNQVESTFNISLGLDYYYNPDNPNIIF